MSGLAHDVRQDRARVLADARGRPAHRAAGGIWAALAEAAPGEDSAALLDRLSHGQRALCVLAATEREVLNGGFGQFLENSTARLVPYLIPAAERVGADAYAGIFAELIALLPFELPLNRDEREAILEEHFGDEEEVRLGELEVEFYDLLDAHETSLEARMWAYVEEHPAEFFADV